MELRRHAFDTVSMRHPDNRRSLFADASEEIALVVDRELCSTVLTMFGFCHLPAGEMRHQLHAITDTKNGNPQIEDFFGYARRLLLVHAGWTTRQHNTLRSIGENGRQGDGAGQNL